jgi:NDP-sugar pyrophosphorylase family protein
MKAMILAAGKGTRLGELTVSKPKILIDIGGVTLLEWIVGKLLHYGFDEIVINIHHKAEMIVAEGELIGKRMGIRITFSDESDNLLDTGGGLYKARSFFGNDPFLLYNGDIVTDLDLKALFEMNIRTGAIATLAVRHRPGNRFFMIDKNSHLSGWINRETGEEIAVNKNFTDSEEIAFSAISVLNPDIFNYMEEGVYSMRPVYLKTAQENVINSLTHDKGVWIDIGNKEQLEKCRSLFTVIKEKSALY